MLTTVNLQQMLAYTERALIASVASSPRARAALARGYAVHAKRTGVHLDPDAPASHDLPAPRLPMLPSEFEAALHVPLTPGHERADPHLTRAESALYALIWPGT